MKKKLTTEEFIKKAKEIHGDKYDYSKVEYVNNKTNVCIICPKHGEFWQIPHKHLLGHKCHKCCKTGIKSNKTEFIEKAKKVHGDKYDYSKVEYVNNSTKVCIICPKHGEFWQTPASHLNGNGCFKCSYIYRGEKKKLTTEEFIEKAKKVHGNKYDYSKVDYVNSHAKICIICPKHGEFWQTPNQHLNGYGCTKCKQSKLEKEIEMLLINNKIEYIEQCGKTVFPWLNNFKFDFYLPKYNIAIECQGKQHFEPVNAFGGKKEYEAICLRDKKKKQLCENNNIKLLYYANYKYDFPYNVLTTHAQLLEMIV
jgi:hypothetical protein